MSQQQLNNALVSLAQHILSTVQDDQLTLAKQLLLDIDASFNQLVKHCHSFAAIKPAIQSYYRTHRQQEINWLDILELYQDFTLIGLFILDLALTSGKQRYIQNILALQEHQQLVLQPFVQQVTQRDHFISPKSPEMHNDQQENVNREHLLELSEENEKMKLQREQIMRAHQDLKQNYDYLKGNYDKVSEELNYLKQERYTLINELGGSECGSVDETIDRVKREIDNYDKTVQKQQKELEEKKAALKFKNEELLKYEQTFKRNRYEQKMVELQQSQVKLSTLQEELTQGKSREDEMRQLIQTLKQHLAAKDEQNNEMRKQLATHETYYNKYMSIKKLHNQFKSKIVKNVKELKE